MNTKQLGNVALSKAIAYYTERGCTVSLPLNDSQSYDLIVERQGKMKRVQVKYTSQKSRSKSRCCIVPLRSISGTSRKSTGVVSSITAEILFVVSSNGRMWSIPTRKIQTVSCVYLNDETNKWRVG